jgi:predicted O-methyltransferase YrrM
MSALERTFRENMDQTGRADAVKILKGRSQDELPNIQDTFDLIYVDGDHTAQSVWQDLQQAHRLLSPGGILVCDDYEWNPVEFQDRPDMTPRPAIDRFMIDRQDEYTLLFKGWQVVMSKRS